MPFTAGHALIIGVGSNQANSDWDAPITVKDAEALAATLRDPQLCGYPAEQVQLLANAEATRQGILDGLDLLAQSAKPQDTIVLFYAGHGAFGTDGKYHLVSHDARFEGGQVVAGSGVAEGELLEKLRAFPAARCLMLFNACHSGAIAPSLGEQESPGASRNPTEDLSNALLGTGSGRILITACREDQRSYYQSQAGLTFFTQALIKGLGGTGVRSNNGFISAYSLYEHLYESVSETIEERYGRKQEPVLTVSKGVGPFAVALYRGTRALGTFDESEPLPAQGAISEVKPEKSQRALARLIQTGGVNFGERNTIKIGGDVVGGDKNVNTTIDARGSQGLINQPSGPVHQNFGTQTRVDTGGGSFIGGGVSTGGGDFVGRDKVVHGDVVQGDKVGGDKISVGNITGSTGVAIGRNAQAHVRTGPGGGDIGALFAAIYQRIEARAGSASENDDLREAVQKIQQETVKQEQADTGRVERALRTLAGLAPEIFDLTVGMLVTPGAAIGSAVRLSAQKVRLEHGR
jgi:hypothetical protein